MRRRWPWVVLLAAVLGLAGYAAAKRLSREGEPEAPAVPVSAERPRRGPIERTLAYAGTLEASSRVAVTPKTEGRIERILVREGDQVRAGQLLARMEEDTARLELEQAESALNAAQAQQDRARKGVRDEELANARALLAQAEKDLADAEESFHRAERLLQEGALARASFEEAERAYRGAKTQADNARRSVQMMEQGASAEEQRLAEANVRASRARADLARLQLEFTRVRSPLAGRVARVPIDEGNAASRGTVLAVIIQDDPLLLRVPIPEPHYAEFNRRGASIRARVRPTALPGAEAFPGKVSLVSPTVNPASRTFLVEVALANPAGLLRAGMYANVEFVLEREEAALLLPLRALVQRAGRQGVFVVDPGPRAGFREVEVGIRDDAQVQVLRALSEQDLVIEEGNAFLEDGQGIAVQER